MNSSIELNPNKLVSYLKKPANSFTKSDIVKYIVENEIKMINFRYVAEDAKLKALNLIITSMDCLSNFTEGTFRYVDTWN
jgi:glutamine synthetase